MQRLLVIEDSSFFQNLIVNGFRQAGDAEVVTATSLRDASAILEKEADTFALALVDLYLPDAHDGEAVDVALAHGVPVVVFTSNFDAQVRQRYLEKGILDFVLKDNPSSFDYLLNFSRRIFKNRQTTVLVVDDSNVALLRCEDLLTRFRLKVLKARSGQEALEILSDCPEIRLIITHHEMPGISGFELVTAIRRMHRRDKLAIIGVSGSGGAPLSVKFLKHGANDFITKPYLPEELYTRVWLNLDTIDHIESITYAATRDFLTGLLNRRSFFELAMGFADDSEKSSISVAAVVMDIDFFKRINDTHGHDGGDVVLKQIAVAVAECAKDVGGLAARFGGEEFVILFRAAQMDEATAFLEHVRAKIETLTIPFKDTVIHATASFGAVVGHIADIDVALAAADQNLYEAKATGRNRAVTTRLA